MTNPRRPPTAEFAQDQRRGPAGRAVRTSPGTVRRIARECGSAGNGDRVGSSRGGNFIETDAAELGIDRVSADYMGCWHLINSLALQNVMESVACRRGPFRHSDRATG